MRVRNNKSEMNQESNRNSQESFKLAQAGLSELKQTTIFLNKY